MIESSQTLSAIAAACLILRRQRRKAPVAQESQNPWRTHASAKPRGNSIDAGGQRISGQCTSPHHFKMVRKKDLPERIPGDLARPTINAARAMAHDLQVIDERLNVGSYTRQVL